MPTLLDLTGCTTPASPGGPSTARARAVLLDPDASGPRNTQYFESVGSRSIYHGGWKATTNHASMTDVHAYYEGASRFRFDRWELPRSYLGTTREAVDLSADEPDRLRDMVQLWEAEALANQVFPVMDVLHRDQGEQRLD